MVKEEEKEGEIDKLDEDEPNEGEFSRRPGKEPMIEEPPRHPLPVPYPHRLKK